jgi:hypothetical protein
MGLTVNQWLAGFDSLIRSQYALLLQLVERTVLEAVKSEFESQRGHQSLALTDGV